jgi:hypothetical protein
MNEDDTILDFYVTSSFSNKEQVKRVIEALTNFETGNVACCTHDWTDETGEDYKDGKELICRKLFDGAMACDWFILLLPAGRSSMTELGLALGHYANVVIWAEKESDFIGRSGRENIFFNHEDVHRVVCPFDEFITLLNAGGLTAFEIDK